MNLSKIYTFSDKNDYLPFFQSFLTVAIETMGKFQETQGTKSFTVSAKWTFLFYFIYENT